MASVEIQGIVCQYRDKEFGEEILYENLPKEDQYFRREVAPFSEDEVMDLSLVSYEDRKSKYTKTQLAWVEREEKRMSDGGGVYAYINGILKYIPGSYWGYINYWVLEHGEKPDYREADRIFFLFVEYIGLHTDVLAITRGKGRRQGATSIGFYLTWWICGRNENKRGGSISYNDTIAQDNFQKMFMMAFRSVAVCFLRDADNKSENFVKFRKKDESNKIGSIRKPKGLNSFVDFLPNSINSYDGGRNSILLLDESGKYEKNNVNTYWSKVYPTLKTGRVKVGFAYMPTTVNPAKKGGENYKKFWNEADQNAINKKTGEKYGLNTRHRVVRYFVPATEGYLGCIDKFGESVIEDPKEPVMGNDGNWITEGSLSVIKKERDMKEGEQFMEHRRDFPLDTFDMFSFESGNCEFNEENVRAQLDILNERPVYLRQVRLVVKKEVEKSIFPGKPDKEHTKIGMMDDAKGGWFIYEMPSKENMFSERGGYFEPLNKMGFQIGVDTTQDRIAIDGSNPCIVVFKKSCIVEGIEMGMYPVAIWISPTRLDIHFDEEVKKACLWWGCTANYELDRRTDFYRYFCKENCQSFLEWTPSIARNPLKKRDRLEYGTRSGDPFQLAQQLQVTKMYVDGDSNDAYNGHVHRIMFPTLLEELLHYNHLDRTKSDQTIALMMSLLPLFGEIQAPTIPRTARSILPTHKIKIPA